MSKPFLTILSMVFVLSAGLVSCAPEKKSKQDVYTASPPVMRTGLGNLSQKDWDALKIKSLDLEDVIDVTAAAPQRAGITTRCAMNGVEYSQVFDLAQPRAISTFSVLPEEILSEDFSQNKISCQFEINLFNEAGSNHIFNLSQVSIKEVKPHPARVVRDPAVDPHLILTLDRLQDVRIRFNNPIPTAARLICQDVVFKELSFDQVLDLNRFDFHGAVIRQGHSPAALIENPVQQCRALIESGKSRVVVSDWFQLVFPHQPLTVERTTFSSGSTTDQTSALAGGRPIIVGAWKITNPYAKSRYVRFSSEAQATTIYAAQISVATLVYAGQNLHFEAYDVPTLYRSDEKTFTVEILPGKSFTLLASIQAAARVGDQCGAHWAGFVFQTMQPARGADVTADGQIIEEFVVENNPTFSIQNISTNIFDLIQQAQKPGAQICPWF